jgi:4-diphosphocytidyl-2-C-methyl-D-erythritol kinase
MRLKAYAKINLSLRVLHKRGDGFHELRTIFQSISLADEVTVEARRSRQAAVVLDDGGLGVADNLMVRAAEAYLRAAGRTARVEMTLRKRIPMGGGLGGGSTDAAAVLRALARLLPAKVDLPAIAAALGSDVPFFLEGGTALGVGRGEELYPLRELRRMWGVVAAPDVHVSTPEAYRALERNELAAGDRAPDLAHFQALSRELAAGAAREAWAGGCENDFEAAVFGRHPHLGRIRLKLQRLGASPARMTGSGAALFGLFASRAGAEAAARAVAEAVGCRAFPFVTVNRAAFGRMG